ncbi:dihydrolipoyl dehydrogenase [Hoylesella enoeca]|uniref:Dihydrolipoyl dehydrogenase n=1 Tax=Hoylesella enoeca TaxID=76123 RepID=A0A0S2KLA5_9BACT|nr:dihydrolipoyl dehydrogenase [Hoylesella enoeca]ALO48894.1 dihydrolipoyl dehydrogenase [Hoylesella enoeca]
MTRTDLLIIGSGPGGYRAAEYAARNGLQVVIVEEAEAGGTCLNCGCIPTKTLCRNAEVFNELKDGDVYGISLSSPLPKINFQRVIERKQQIVEQLRKGVETLMASPGITFLRGKAQLKDGKTVIVNGEEITADNIIIATGSRAKIPPIEGIDLSHVITSTELLDIDHVPQRLCIIGAGVIGMEFASIFSSFCSKVTVIEFLKECLPTLDSDIAKRLRKTLERNEIDFHLQSGVKKIEETGHALTVTFEKKGKEAAVEADIVLVATGREPRIEGLGLAEAGIAYDRKGITVNENMQTNVSSVYAIGDVNGRQMLAHAATFQGFRAVNHILGKADHIRFDIMPSAIFTHPEAGSVGMTEDSCKANDIECKCYKGHYRSNGKALAMNEFEGLIKLVIDAHGLIIGCHAFGAHASDIVQEVTALINRNTTITDLRDIIHTHPTLSEILQDIALTAS